MPKFTKLYKTRFPELCYTQIEPNLWMFVSVEDNPEGSQVGPHYASKAELLADLTRYGNEYCGIKTVSKKMYLGLCEAETSISRQLVIISETRTRAEKALFDKWRSLMRPDFEPAIRNFEDLHEWNGATVNEITPDAAFIWEQLPDGIPQEAAPEPPTPADLLETAQEAQRLFWEALSALESATGAEIDGTADLSAKTLEDLDGGQ